MDDDLNAGEWWVIEIKPGPKSRSQKRPNREVAQRTGGGWIMFDRTWIDDEENVATFQFEQDYDPLVSVTPIRRIDVEV